MARKVCVVGLDGVPVGLLRRLVDDGVMPRTAELAAAGSLRPMRASIPEISSVSWTSFMTGAQPGEHGIFGFTDLLPGGYDLVFPGFGDVATATFWDRLGDEGRRSVVVNQPSTYPARTIPGALVSGFVAVDLRRAVKPLRHLGPLRRLDYRIDVDTGRARQDHDYLMRDLAETLAARERAVDYLWGAEDWDYFQLVVTGTDRLYHFLWDALDDADHPRHEAVLDYHRAVDALVGRVHDRLVDEYGDDASFWMLSDHGFCGIVQEVQLNAVLQEGGFLSFDGDPADGLAAMAPSSRAFALDPGRIHVHRSDRFPRGTVEAGEVAGVCADLVDRLGTLEWNGDPVVRRIHEASEIYSGPRLAAGPDLVVQSNPGFDLKASTTVGDAFGATAGLVGMHTWDDAFLLAPRPVEGDELWIGDLADMLMRELRE